MCCWWHAVQNSVQDFWRTLHQRLCRVAETEFLNWVATVINELRQDRLAFIRSGGTFIITPRGRCSPR
jgi:hypothetical protein